MAPAGTMTYTVHVHWHIIGTWHGLAALGDGVAEVGIEPVGSEVAWLDQTGLRVTDGRTGGRVMAVLSGSQLELKVASEIQWFCYRESK